MSIFQRRSHKKYPRLPFLRTGFTFVELMIVVSIIALIMTGILGGYRLTQKSSRDGRRKTDFEKLRQALEIYRSDVGSYPSVGSGAWTEVSNLSVLVSDYIDQLPIDPKQTVTVPYKYRATDLSGGNYYGYCIEAALEVSTPTSNPCTPETDYNFTVKNP